MITLVNINCFYADLMKGYKAAESNNAELGERSLMVQCQAVADMKFAYVVSCQQYGIDKRAGEDRAKDILKLMRMYVVCSIASFELQLLSDSHGYLCFLSLWQVSISSSSLH